MIVVAAIVVGAQHGPGPGREVPALAGPQAALRRRHRDRALRQTRPAAGGADRRPLAAQAGGACGPSLNWLLDAASLWVFVRAFGGALDIDALLVAFGLANIFAVIPITPGGLGIVEGVYIPTLIGFGADPPGGDARRARRTAWPSSGSRSSSAGSSTPACASGRGRSPASRLDRLRDVARRETAESERRLESPCASGSASAPASRSRSTRRATAAAVRLDPQWPRRSTADRAVRQRRRPSGPDDCRPMPRGGGAAAARQ